MPTFKVNIKWGKEKFEDVECSTEESPMLFKAQLFALSGVQPDRQKVMSKGVALKDDDWGKFKLKDGATLLMMGTAEALPQEPVDKPVFMEDMTESELASALEMPPGLTNLGNTCYMNATLQCLKTVPELRDSLKKFTGRMQLGGGAVMPDESITAAVKDLFDNMDRTGQAVPPIVMLNVLHMCFPQFAEKNDQGTWQQQDANECWTELVRCLQKKLPTSLTDTDSQASAARGFMDQYFGGEFSISMKCIEAEEEETAKSKETFYQLSCFIEKEVKYLLTGLKSRLEEHIAKHSPTLGRDAQYLKTCKISRLPAYLTVQMVRFFYKGKEAVNAKILKDIKFPMVLDVYDLCEEDLQKKLLPIRERMKEEDDKRADDLQKERSKGLPKDLKVEKKATKEPFSFANDVGSNNSGYYELQAVLTHKGRSSSSGHYVAWSKRKGDEWLMFDDDNVSPIHADDILKLSGGGDWHCAYVLLYGPRVLEIEEREEEQKDEATETTGKADAVKAADADKAAGDKETSMET